MDIVNRISDTNAIAEILKMTKTYITSLGDNFTRKDDLLAVLTDKFPGTFTVDLDSSPIYSRDKLYWERPYGMEHSYSNFIYHFVSGYLAAS